MTKNKGGYKTVKPYKGNTPPDKYRLDPSIQIYKGDEGDRDD